MNRHLLLQLGQCCRLPEPVRQAPMGQISSVSGDGPSPAAGASLAAGMRHALMHREREDRDGSPRPQGEGNSQSVRNAIDIYIENCLNSNSDRETGERSADDIGRRSSSEPGSLSSIGDAGNSGPAVSRSNTVAGFSKYLMNKIQDTVVSSHLEDGEDNGKGEDSKAVKVEVKTEPPATSTAAAAAAPSGKENVEKEGEVAEVKTEEAEEVKTEVVQKEVVEVKTETVAGEDKDETSSEPIEIVDVEKMTPPPSPGKAPKPPPVDSPGAKPSTKEEKGGLPMQPAVAGGRDSAPFNCQSVPLQVIIDRVLDTSLGEDNSLPKHLPPITSSSSSPLSLHREGLPKLSSMGHPDAMAFSSALSRTTSAKSQDRGSDSARDPKSGGMKVEGKNVVFLMEHIERVLEHSFANHDSNKHNESEEEGTKLPPNSAASSSATQSRSRSPPVHVSATATSTITTTSSKTSHEGSISVQDIVDRVISQTEVISKSAVPHSSASSSGLEHTSSSSSSSSTNRRPSPTERGHPSVGSVPRPDLLHPESRHNRDEDKGYRSAFSPSSHSMRHHTSSRLEEGREVPHPYRMDHSLAFKSDVHPVVGSPNGMTWLPPHMSPMPLSMVSYSSDVAKGLMPPNYFKMPGHPATRQPPPLIRGDKLHEMSPHPPTKGCYCASCTMALASGEALHGAVGHSPLSVHRPSSHGLGPHSKHHGYPPHSSLSPYTQPLHPSPQFNSQLMPAAVEKHPSSREVPKSSPGPHAKVSPSAAQRPMYPVPGITTGVPPRPPKAQPLVREMVEVPSHGSISRGEPVYQGSYMPYGASSAPHAQAAYPGLSTGRSRGSEVPSSGHGVPSHSMVLPEAVRPERKRESILDLSVKGLPEPRSSPSVERAPDSYPDEQPLDLSKKPSMSSAGSGSVGRDDSSFPPHPRKYLLHEVKDSAHFHHGESSASPHSARPDPSLLTPVGPGHVALPVQQAESHPGAAVYPQSVDYHPQPPRGDPLLLQPRPAPFSTSPAMPSYPPLETSPLAAAGRDLDSAGKGGSSSPVTRPPPGAGDRQDSSSSSGSSSGSSKRTNVSRHEPLQNIIGSHPANDILFLRCLMCNQTYGSPYGFRKHFRNQHGFEPKAEHAEVASISAERSLRQGSDVTQDSPIPSDTNSHSPGTPDLMCGMGSGEDLIPKQDLGPELRLEGGSGKPKRSYSRGSDGRPQSAEESASEDKCLRCQTCGQSFQLNDFGGFKRHNRQHNQSRTTGLYSCPECHLSLQDPMLLQEHIANAHRQRSGEGSSKAFVCKVCGERFSSTLEYDQHLVEVHNQRLYSCDLCTANFLDSYEFEHHRQTTHGGQSHGGGRLLEVQRLPADAVTTTASPDSSSDNAATAQEQQPSSNTPSLEGSRSQGSNKMVTESSTAAAASSSPDVGTKTALEEVSTSRAGGGKEEEKEGESGRRSCSSSESRTQSCESHNDTSSQPSPCGSDDPHPDIYYKHKKFAMHRKRADSMDSDARSKKGGDEKDAYDSDSNSVSSCPERKKPRLDMSKASEGFTDSQGTPSSEKGATGGKEGGGAGAEGKEGSGGAEGEDGEDSQQGVVWDRVTRSQAGKIIKPPDYMT